MTSVSLRHPEVVNKVVGNAQSWSWNNSGTGRQCGFPLKWPTKKKNPNKVQPPRLPTQKTGLGGPIGLGHTQDLFWGLKLKIHYKKRIFGAFFVFMKNKLVSLFWTFFSKNRAFLDNLDKNLFLLQGLLLGKQNCAKISYRMVFGWLLLFWLINWAKTDFGQNCPKMLYFF